MMDDIGYQALTQSAMRGVMKQALKIAASGKGLPGDHHFFVTFRTRAPGVTMAEHLIKKFPDEMTIVIQHQFWDLEVHERHFEVVLQFSGVPQHISIPYTTVTRFVDPSVNFAIGFQPMAVQQPETMDDVATDEPETEAEKEAARKAAAGTVVSLDAFRRK